MARRKKAERLTTQILRILDEIGRIHSLTEQEAWQIKCAVETAAREMHLQRKVTNETPIRFSLQDEPDTTPRE